MSNILLYPIIFIITSLVTALFVPDIDQNIFSFLGHRSIFTHSILIPYIFHYYFVKKKTNVNDLIKFISFSLYFGFSIHFCADLIVKGWRGTALIVIFGNALPAFLSICWIFANAVLSMIFANKILFEIYSSKKIIYSYFFLGIPVAFFYFLTDYIGKPGPQLVIFFVIHISIFFYFLKKNKNKVTVKEIKPKEIKEKKNYIPIIVIILIILSVIILILDNIPSQTSKNKRTKSSQENYRSKSVYKDEFELCSSYIKKTYPNTKFTKIKVSGFYAPSNQASYYKILRMWGDHEWFMMNMSFGKIDCKIRVNADQSIAFVELSDKY